MKGFSFSLFLLLFLGNLQLLFSNNTELLKAESQLENRGEVYYKFYANSINDLINLRDKISIDKVNGNEVIAYANKDEFAEFLKTNLYYEVLTPPSLQGPAPEMSDYKDVTFPLADWTKYPSYSGYLTIMKQLETSYPQLVLLDTIGTSINNKQLLVAKVSDNVKNHDPEPAFMYCGAIHGDEIASIILTMRLIDWLCSNYQKDARATRILDSMELYVSPMINPDGTYKGGDASVSGAGRYNNSNVDLNRNYPKVPGGGVSQTQEKETKAYIAFAKSNYISMDISYHAGTETCIYPYSGAPRRTVDENWWKIACGVYAKLAQQNGQTGYFDDFGGDGVCNGYYEFSYVAEGTTKDYFTFFTHGRSISIEVSTTKPLPETSLENWWNYNRDAMLAYMVEALNGIRGMVTDSVTGAGKKAKVFVQNFDKDDDSSFVYADVPHGDYYRPIIAGTYNVTYSCPGCVSKTVNGISVQNGKATIVNVKLDCGNVGIENTASMANVPVTITPFLKGVKITYGLTKNIVRAAIYDVTGKLVKVLPVEQGHNSIVWNGLSNDRVQFRAGCYILKVQADGKSFSKQFALTR